LWRRRGDSNPRTVLPAYSLSRGMETLVAQSFAGYCAHLCTH